MAFRRGVLLLVVLGATARADEPAAPASLLGHADGVNGEEIDGYVAFTFDDGPKLSTTPKVIEALVEYDIPAAFFVVGNRLVGKRHQKERDLVAKMIELGFEVGNHTYSHEHLKALNDKSMVWQIDRTSNVIAQITGKPTELFRPPYGSPSKKSSAHVIAQGLTSVLWSIDSSDWRKPKDDKMRKAVVDGIFRENGGVVLFHDTKKITARTIHGILDDLEAANCAKLAANEPIIVPVSLHYFLKDGGKARAIPADIEARTQRYRDALPGRCKAR